MQKVEFPFVVGVMADLSGYPKDPLKPLKDRKAVYVDRDNFNDVLAKATPRVTRRGADKRSGEEDKLLPVELQFRHIDDFEPARVAEQIPALKELLEMRHRLNQL